MSYIKRIKTTGVTLPNLTDHNKDAWVLDSTDAGRGVSIQLYTGDTMTRKLRRATLEEALQELQSLGYDTDDNLVNELGIPGRKFLTVNEYAALHNTTPDNIRHRIYNKRHPDAHKHGAFWEIPEDSPYEDGREK